MIIFSKGKEEGNLTFPRGFLFCFLVSLSFSYCFMFELEAGLIELFCWLHFIQRLLWNYSICHLKSGFKICVYCLRCREIFYKNINKCPSGFSAVLEQMENMELWDIIAISQNRQGGPMMWYSIKQLHVSMCMNCYKGLAHRVSGCYAIRPVVALETSPFLWVASFHPGRKWPFKSSELRSEDLGYGTLGRLNRLTATCPHTNRPNTTAAAHEYNIWL